MRYWNNRLIALIMAGILLGGVIGWAGSHGLWIHALFAALFLALGTFMGLLLTLTVRNTFTFFIFNLGLVMGLIGTLIFVPTNPIWIIVAIAFSMGMAMGLRWGCWIDQ